MLKLRTTGHSFRQAPNWLSAIRGLASPSTAMRLVWLAAAAFHAWLILRRLVTGEWTTPPELLRAGLCLAGVWYASLKFWRVSTIFDSRPRRAFAFFLVVTFGHGLVASPAVDAALQGPGMQAVALAVIPAIGLGAALSLLDRARRVFKRIFQAAIPAAKLLAPAFIEDLPLFPDFSPLLFRRPPPAIA